MSCGIKSILTSLQKTTFVEYFYPTKEAIVVSNEFDAISPAINVYLLLIIVGIEPIDKPSKTIKIPPTIPPCLKMITAVPIKNAAMIFPHVPVSASLISVYHVLSSAPPVPANAADEKKCQQQTNEQ